MSKHEPKNVLITRQPEQSERFRTLLTEAGCTPYLLPMIEVRPVELAMPTEPYDYVVFASPNAVTHFKPYLDSALDSITAVVAVGDKTADTLEKLGVTVDLLPEEFSAKGLIQLFMEKDVSGTRFLLPGARRRTDTFIEFLRQRGADIDAPTVYETSAVTYEDGRIDSFLDEFNIGTLTFASPSAVDAFFSQSEIDPKEFFIVSIGATTATALEKHGITDIHTPGVFSIEAMVDTIRDLIA